MYLLMYEVPTMLGVIVKYESFESIEELTARAAKLDPVSYPCRVFKELEVNVPDAKVCVNEPEFEREWPNF